MQVRLRLLTSATGAAVVLDSRFTPELADADAFMLTDLAMAVRVARSLERTLEGGTAATAYVSMLLRRVVVGVGLLSAVFVGLAASASSLRWS